MGLDSLDAATRWLLAAPIYGLAYLCAGAIFWWAARRRGIDAAIVWRVLSAGLVGGLIGANLVQILATGMPGKAIEGGIIGGWLTVVAVKRRFGITVATGDLFALAIPLGEAIGRIACFIGGCCYGKIATHLPWAVYDHGAFRHPSQLYLSLLAACAFVVLLNVERARILPQNGLFYLGGMLFCIDRFVVEFFRADATMTPFGITLAQLGCEAGFIVFAVLFVRKIVPLRAARAS